MIENNIVFLSLYFPKGSGGYTFREKLMNVLHALDNIDKVICINSDSNFKYTKGDKFEFINMGNHDLEEGISKLYSYLIMQVKALIYLVKLRDKYSMITVMAGNNFTVPLLFAKMILRKKILYLMSGVAGISAWKHCRLGNNKRLSLIPAILDEISLAISNLIVLESPHLFYTLKLDKYYRKIFKNGHLYVDINKFFPIKKVSDRGNVIGYIGRLSKEKGILNFLKAVPKILKEKDDLEFLIIGNGDLWRNIKKYLYKNDLNKKVKLLGRIAHAELPNYLNEVKLVILPSNIEGLPNILIESMACGTPILTTPVGGIPDMIKDGETGFIMENNTSECIAKNAIRALNYPDLEKITENGRRLIQQEFTFEKVVERWKKIFKIGDDINEIS